jgi:hypothetical protein
MRLEIAAEERIRMDDDLKGEDTSKEQFESLRDWFIDRRNRWDGDELHRYNMRDYGHERS